MLCSQNNMPATQRMNMDATDPATSLFFLQFQLPKTNKTDLTGNRHLHKTLLFSASELKARSFGSRCSFRSNQQIKTTTYPPFPKNVRQNIPSRIFAFLYFTTLSNRLFLSARCLEQKQYCLLLQCH